MWGSNLFVHKVEIRRRITSLKLHIKTQIQCVCVCMLLRLGPDYIELFVRGCWLMVEMMRMIGQIIILGNEQQNIDLRTLHPVKGPCKHECEEAIPGPLWRTEYEYIVYMGTNGKWS